MPRERITSQRTNPEDHGRVLIIGWGNGDNSLQTATSTDPDGSGAEWVTLDRAGANRAIRALRRARDAAFGRDE